VARWSSPPFQVSHHVHVSLLQGGQYRLRAPRVWAQHLTYQAIESGHPVATLMFEFASSTRYDMKPHPSSSAVAVAMHPIRGDESRQDQLPDRVGGLGGEELPRLHPGAHFHLHFVF
jgi:hypothetical protein